MTFKKPAVVINIAGGSTSDISEEIGGIFSQQYGTTADCHVVEPDKLVETMTKVINEGADLLVTYGGDGTALCGISIANPKGVPVLPLPGGTMNMLHKSLYGSDDWKEVLSLGMAETSPFWVPGGQVNDKLFLVGAMFGPIVRIGITRELIREGEIIEATKNAAETIKDAAPDEGFSYKISGKSEAQSANLLNMSCPFMNPASNDPDNLEVSAVDVDNLAQISTVGLSALRGDWRDSNSVESDFANSIEISGPKELDFLTDGEHDTVKLPVEVKFKRKAALILCPPPDKRSSA